MVQSPVYFRLGNVDVWLLSNSPEINNRWQQILGPWAEHQSRQHSGPVLTLRLDLDSTLPSLPQGPPIFRDHRGIIDVYSVTKERFLLHFQAGGLMEVDVTPGAMAVEGTITPRIFAENRLEDVTFTSLAAPLRRFSHYLLHAAGASNGDNTVLFTGASHSGKTTTSLALMLAGWKYVANDLVLLVPHQDNVQALPTPSELTVRKKTLELLPELREYQRSQRYGSSVNKANATVCTLNLAKIAWARGGPVTTICFPRVTRGPQSHLKEIPAAVGLARLMEESVDRWDRELLDDHVDLLTALCRQCHHYELQLSEDVGRLPELLAGQGVGGTAS